MELAIAIAFGLLFGINVGAVSAWFILKNRQPTNIVKPAPQTSEDAPVDTTEVDTEVEQPETIQAGFWQQTADTLE